MSIYKTPGVYTEEISTLPPSVGQVSTAIPAFIGYTEKSESNAAVRISTFLEFKDHFGGPELTQVSVNLNPNETIKDIQVQSPSSNLYYALDFYFKNGGGTCHVISVGNYSDGFKKEDFLTGLDTLSKEDEPTLIVLGEATKLAADDYYEVCKTALIQCANLGDRFCILDVLDGDEKATAFRTGIGGANLKYGAAYTPSLLTTLNYQYEESDVIISGLQTTETLKLVTNGIEVTYNGPASDEPKVKINKGTGSTISFTAENGLLTIGNVGEGVPASAVIDQWNTFPGKENFELHLVGGESDLVTSMLQTSLTPTSSSSITLASAKTTRTTLYGQVVNDLAKQRIILPPSAGIAGIYCTTDRERGVWKSPANVSLNAVIAPTEKISVADQENLNMDVDGGKSVNAIRSFSGKGILVWGARTLAGNDNEWRYISVRRLFNMIEESTQKASSFAVFEANNAATWLKVKAMIDSYLYGIWQQGALVGASAEQAYFVNIGLGKTMTQQDILEGKMIVEIGIAAVRPAEFIILKFSHKLQEA